MAKKKWNWRTLALGVSTTLLSLGSMLATDGSKAGMVASVVVLAVGGLLKSIFTADAANLPAPK